MGRPVLRLAILAALAAGAPSAAEQPDLSGLWTNASITTLERPAGLPTLELSDAEAAAYEASHPGTPEPTRGGAVGADQTEWWEMGGKLGRLRGRARSSWIIDPADGRLPFSEAGLAALLAEQAAAQRFDAPELRPAPERCLMGVQGSSLPPMLNPGYNNLLRIVQTPTHVVILAEMNAGPRIIPLADATRPPGPDWNGHSVGRWEGSTLVVETSGFHPQAQWRAPGRLYISTRGKVTERFTPISADEVRYAFEVDDPATYTRIWSGEMPLRRSPGPLYEFACHEGNYALPGILAGGREEERAAAGRP